MTNRVNHVPPYTLVWKKERVDDIAQSERLWYKMLERHQNFRQCLKDSVWDFLMCTGLLYSDIYNLFPFIIIKNNKCILLNLGSIKVHFEPFPRNNLNQISCKAENVWKQNKFLKFLGEVMLLLFKGMFPLWKGFSSK